MSQHRKQWLNNCCLPNQIYLTHQVSLQTPKRNLFIQTQETPNPASLKVFLVPPFAWTFLDNAILGISFYLVELY